MQKIYLFIGMLFLAGCSTVAFEPAVPQSADKVFHDLDGRRNLTNISHVYEGMTYLEVLSIMGDKINIGYRQDKSTLNVLEPITLKSPYRMEMLRAEDKVYNVIYYYTRIQKSDGIVSEDELTPLVFEGERLIGKGRDYLFQLKNKINS